MYCFKTPKNTTLKERKECTFDKYEIISGHNRVKAMKELGHSTILAKIENDLTEDKALEIFYESNFNQQSFSDWNYDQRIEARILEIA